MKEFISYLTQYSSLLREGAVWRNSREILAPVFSDRDGGNGSENYIYEFYCYISIIVDLMSKYEIRFVEGKGSFRYKFPQAAAEKRGKPRFEAIKKGKLAFQICAGTKISCEMDSEENHPDISFQRSSASESPTQKDLIFIIDAKYRENPNSSLSKDEVYKFATIVRLFGLNNSYDIQIEFDEYSGLKGNCLLTNGKAYSDAANTKFLKMSFIKEVESFYPGGKFLVLG